MTVAWRGPVLDRSPWAAGTRAVLAGFRALGAPVALEPLLWHPGSVVGPARRRELAEMSSVPLHDATATVQHMPARVLDPYVRGPLRVALTSLPGALPGEDWLLRLRQMDDVWVPSALQRAALVAAGLDPARVAVMPEPVEVPAAPAEPLPLDDLHGTVVLAIADRTARSGWDLVIDAWCRAFDAGDDVTLALVPFAGEALDDDAGAAVLEMVGRLGHDPARMADVVLLDEPVPAESMGRLFAAADVACAATRGMGRGRDLVEAMAHGLPVIAPPAAAGVAIDAAVGWALSAAGDGRGPDRDALVAALRDAHARAGELPALGAAARERVAPHEASRVAARALERLEGLRPRHRRAPAAGAGPRVALYGGVTGAHSLALANRSLAAALVRGGEVDLSLVEVETAARGGGGALPGGPALRAARRLLDGPPEVVLRHGYPPSFTPPPAGRLVVALPWEYGPIPLEWRRGIEDAVDEVWAPSRYVRDGYLASGLDPDRVAIVPHGVDTARFRPGLEALPLAGVPGGYRFLFVGGLLWRKGADLLLDAYATAFTAADDVTLVVKDFGRGGPYRPQEIELRVERMAADPRGPRVAFLRDRLPDADLPRLYAAADCLVHPYRGEGYGLTVAEGMACGLPVIVPEGGSTADFCDHATALLVPSRPVVLEGTGMGGMELAGRPRVVEVSVLDLARRMRDAYERRDEASAVGLRAAAHVAAHHTWDHAAAIAAARMRALAGHDAPAAAPATAGVA
ncbi:glycosyltransferase [Miltoncostaea marina]|uniref:glycosyltransferase n=1 Tax=Miltoncostaea marina TaxID=2843215 RepID=UPI001C3CA006|nr:glycosyltransferase [Miltoncostaea marina]